MINYIATLVVYNPMLRKTQAIAMVLPKLTASLGVFVRKDYTYYDSGVLFNHLVNPDLWQMSSVTGTLHAVNSNQFLM